MTPEKNWKFSMADVEERKYWKHYMKAYEACLSATSTAAAPWYVVPADDKGNTQLIVSRIVLDALKELKLEYPKSSARSDLQELRKHPQDYSLRRILAADAFGFNQPSDLPSVDAASAGPQVFCSYSWTGVTSPSTGSTILHWASI